MGRSDIDYCILAATAWPTSGREITHACSKALDRTVPYGTIYPALARLKKLGLLTETISEDEDGRVKSFQITGKGVEVRNRECRRFERMARVGRRSAKESMELG